MLAKSILIILILIGHFMKIPSSSSYPPYIQWNFRIVDINLQLRRCFTCQSCLVILFNSLISPFNRKSTLYGWYVSPNQDWRVWGGDDGCLALIIFVQSHTQLFNWSSPQIIICIQMIIQITIFIQSHTQPFTWSAPHTTIFDTSIPVFN